MTIYELLGFFWIAGGTTFSTILVAYFAWKGMDTAWRQLRRGASEEFMDSTVKAIAKEEWWNK